MLTGIKTNYNNGLLKIENNTNLDINIIRKPLEETYSRVLENIEINRQRTEDLDKLVIIIKEHNGEVSK